VTGRWARRLGVLAAGIAAGAAGSLALAPAAAAHPLGNFTVNQYSGLRVQPDGVVVDYVLDMAEIPAFQTRSQEVDADRDGVVSPAEQDRWRAASCRRLSTQVTVSADGVPVPLSVARSALGFPAGTAGLVTLRLDCTLHGPARVDRPVHLSYQDAAYTDRVGWREVTAVGDGTTLAASTVPATSASDRLRVYPAGLLAAPLDVRGAELDARPGGSRVAAAPTGGQPRAPLARGVDRATSAFTALIGQRRLTVAFGLAAVLLSVLLGALHALAPGHGKTAMAAFLVGGGGTLRQALAVGLAVTATHTVGVLVLGAVLVTSVTLAPQRLYPWLGLVSGVLLAGVGASLIRRGRAGARGHGHDHGDDHGDSRGHGHGRGDDHGSQPARRHDDGAAAAGHPHPREEGRADRDRHGYPRHQHPAPALVSAQPGAAGAEPGVHPPSPGRAGNGPPIRRRALLVMGFVGGMVPSPSALVVLLGAVALGRTWFGMLLVVGYGAGMAAALMGIGLLLARGRRFLERRNLHPRARAITARLPVLTAGLIVAVGLGLATQAAVALLAA
jgi:ABC-type nickel/cobalt efflux system permease component RcnA